MRAVSRQLNNKNQDKIYHFLYEVETDIPNETHAGFEFIYAKNPRPCPFFSVKHGVFLGENSDRV